MIFYIIVYTVAIALAWLSDRLASGQSRYRFILNRIQVGSKVCSNLFLIFSALTLMLVRGLRCGIGVDYFFAYVPKFEVISNGGEAWGDKLYGGLIWLCSVFSSDWRVFFFIDSVIFISLIYLAIWLSNGSRAVSVAIFCLGFHYVRSMNMQAQYFAAALCLVAISLLVFQGKVLLSLLSCLAAAMFHMTSLIMFPILLLGAYLYKIRDKQQRYILLSVCLAFPLLSVLLRGIIPYTLQSLLSGSRFAGYFGSSFDDNDFATDLFLINFAIYVAMIAIILVKFIRSESPNGSARQIIMAALFQSCALSASILTGSVPLIYRIAYYFMISHVVLLEPVTKLLSRRMAQMGLFAVLVCFSLVHFLFLSPGDSDRVIPYHSIFDSDEQIELVRTEIENINS